MVWYPKNDQFEDHFLDPFWGSERWSQRVSLTLRKDMTGETSTRLYSWYVLPHVLPTSGRVWTTPRKGCPKLVHFGYHPWGPHVTYHPQTDQFGTTFWTPLVGPNQVSQDPSGPDGMTSGCDSSGGDIQHNPPCNPPLCHFLSFPVMSCFMVVKVITLLVKTLQNHEIRWSILDATPRDHGLIVRSPS